LSKRKVNIKPAIPTETELQISVVEYLTTVGKNLDAFFFHVPNQGIRKGNYANKLKRMGLKSGVSDLVFILPGGKVGCIELKRERGGSQTQPQKDFQKAVEKLGCPYVLCKSLENVLDTLKKWKCL